MIADKLYNLPSFQRQYDSILELSVCETVSNLQWNQERDLILSKIDWNNSLSIASVLSYSDTNAHLDAALRVAQTCLTQGTTSESQKIASAIILENLTNKPAIKLAIERNLLRTNYNEDYPFIFKLQTIQTEVENSILVKDKLITLNQFQKKVHNVYEENETISISAPTSAGKSFILCTILLEELLEGVKNIVYLVPTRALISQVEFDLRELTKKHNINSVNISTVPQSELDDQQSNVFVFTQERLHWFLMDNPNLKLNLLIIDEAHKIEDGNRGILLQQKIEEVVKRHRGIKVFFSSPFTSNPEILLDNVINDSKKEKVNTQFVAVNQNLIYITQVPRKPEVWELTLYLSDKKIILGTVNLHDRPTPEAKKLPYIANAFCADQTGNIIYANGAADAEKTAQILYNLIKNEDSNGDLNELSKLVKKTVHKDYLLVKVLKKGIAFHYGNMPLLIRQEIERLFKKGIIKYLVCTSTLLEGINLPAKSIFIRKPTRGRGHPLDQNDFWNLAGRAGRWGKEYSGNIVCIEPTRWEQEPNPNKSKQVIKRAIDIIENDSEDLFEFIKKGTPRTEANSRQDLEFAFGYYYLKYLNGELESSTAFNKGLLDVLPEIIKKITVPIEIIRRNPGISPIAQQELLDYFNTKLDKIEDYVPVYPEDDNAIAEYIKLVGRIGKTIADYPSVLNHSRSILLVNWMSGKPLAYLIQASIKYYEKKEVNKTTSAIIREVMDNVENYVRFRFAKDSSCYIDILRHVLEKNGRTDLLKRLPQLNLWLEFGVSQKTHLSLLSLGLSRNTVVELTTYITNTTMTKSECIEWLKEQDFEQMELSPIIVEEIKRIIANV